MSRPIQEIREDIAAVESLIKAQLHLERLDEDSINLLDRCVKRLNALLTEIEERAERKPGKDEPGKDEPEKDDVLDALEYFKKWAEREARPCYPGRPSPWYPSPLHFKQHH